MRPWVSNDGNDDHSDKGRQAIGLAEFLNEVEDILAKEDLP